MHQILEATKKDGSRQLLSCKFLRDIDEQAKARGYKQSRRTIKFASELLSRAMYLNGFVRLESVVYGEGKQMRSVIVELA